MDNDESYFELYNVSEFGFLFGHEVEAGF